MNEQNNNVNNNSTLSNGQVETLHPMPSTVTTTTQQPQVATVSSVNTNQNNNNQPPLNQEPPKKGGNFKYILVFIFLIGILAFVFFLPEISTYVQSKKTSTSTTTTNTQIENGTLTCNLEKTTDETDTYYEIDYVFTNKKLITSNLITTIESTNTEYLNAKKLEYDTASSISNNISGISMDCSLSAGILTISENYTHKDIDTNKLTPYVEAGGTYPEFKYQKNIYDIQTTMIKKGYDCSVTAAVK